MTTLTEFKEIEMNIESEIDMGREPLAKIASKGMICYEAFPALIAVAEGMAEALKQATPFIGWVPTNSQKILEPMEQALAAFEAWKGKIEGEG